MSDQPALAPSSSADDSFERELRSLLRERAAGPVPDALRRDARDVTLRPPVRTTMGLRRPMVLLAAAVAGLLAISAGFNPVDTVRRAVLGPAAAPSGSPGSTADPSGPPAPAIDWDAGSTRLTAESLRITVGGQVYTGLVGDVSIHADDAGVTSRTLELEWREHGRPMRLHLYLAADRGAWWITEIRTYDGSPAGDWITYPAPGWRMPLGATWTGDLRLAAPGGTLQIDGARLRAFSPDSLPRELRLCRPAVDPAAADATDPLAAGEPLADSGILAMTPATAKRLLTGMGLCHSFRYRYQYGGGSDEGYSEVWCDPPPGVIQAVHYGGSGEVIVMTGDAAPQLHTPRPQPPVGWGC